MKTVFISMIGATAICGLPQITYAEMSWPEKPYCTTQNPLATPESVTKEKLHIIGVSINNNGEFVRLEPKDKVLRQLPDIVNFSDQSDWFAMLNFRDFRKSSPKKIKMVTPLDAVSPANEAASFAYVLLPKSWVYTEGESFSLKEQANAGDFPVLSYSKAALNEKTAIIHQGRQYLRDGQSCDYDFNIHVDIVQGIQGGEMRTKVIIDPVIKNTGGPD